MIAQKSRHIAEKLNTVLLRTYKANTQSFGDRDYLELTPRILSPPVRVYL